MAQSRRRPHSAFRRWLVRLALWLAPMCVLWWWLHGADWYLRSLSLLADATLPHWVLGDVREIFWLGNQNWKVRTQLMIVNSAEILVVFVVKQELMHLVLGFPLLWALLLATVGPKKLRLALGTLLLTVVSLLGVAAHIWVLLVTVINHRASEIVSNLAPPTFTVMATAYPDWLFHLSSFAYFLAVIVVPLLAPVLIWILLCPRGIMRLVVSIQRNNGKSTVVS
jgi:hypothetical protein